MPVAQGTIAPRFRQIALAPEHGLAPATASALARLSEHPPAPLAELPETRVDAIVGSWRSVLDSAAMDALPSLRYIGLRATSLARVDLAHARRHGIAVRNIEGYGDQATAEFALAELLRARREGGEDGARELAGARLGLVGMGRVAARVARAAAALGADVRYFSPSRRESPADVEAHWRPLESLLAESELVSFHSPPLTPVAGAEDLARIEPGVTVLVTTLGLPFALEDLTRWCHSGKRRVVLDLVAADDREEMLARLPGVEVRPLYAARTAESVARADGQVVARMAEFLGASP